MPIDAADIPPPPTPPVEAEFRDILSTLYASKHTGPVIFHFQSGIPTLVEWGRPASIRITHPKRK